MSHPQVEISYYTLEFSPAVSRSGLSMPPCALKNEDS